MNNKSNRLLSVQTLVCLLVSATMSASIAADREVTVSKLKLSAIPSNQFILIEVGDETLRFQGCERGRNKFDVERLSSAGVFEHAGRWELHGATKGQQAGRLTLVEMGIMRLGQRLEYKCLKGSNQIKQTGIIKAIRFSEIK